MNHPFKVHRNISGNKTRRQSNFLFFFFSSTTWAAPLLPSSTSAGSVPAPPGLQFRFPQGSSSSRPAATQKPKQRSPQETSALFPSSLHTEGPQQRTASTYPLRPSSAQVLLLHPSTSSSPQRKENSSEQGDIRGGAGERQEDRTGHVDPFPRHSAHL